MVKVAALALVNRRNDELHTGSSAFQEYPSKIWLAGFYRACHLLAEAMGETLESLFSTENAKVANEILAKNQAQVKSRILSLIAAHQKVFLEKSPEDQKAASESARTIGEQLAHKRHHRVTCLLQFRCDCSRAALREGKRF